MWDAVNDAAVENDERGKLPEDRRAIDLGRNSQNGLRANQDSSPIACDARVRDEPRQLSKWKVKAGEGVADSGKEETTGAAWQGSTRNERSKFQPGDFYCKSCGDHQFARNKWCRWCGAAVEAGEGTDQTGKVKQPRELKFISRKNRQPQSWQELQENTASWQKQSWWKQQEETASRQRQSWWKQQEDTASWQ